MKKMAEGSPMEEKMESAEEERKEPPTEHELDMHHKTLMDAESIRGDAHIMKHLKPHMEKKMGHMKKVMGMKEKASPITSLEGIRAKEKSLA